MLVFISLPRSFWLARRSARFFSQIYMTFVPHSVRVENTKTWMPVIVWNRWLCGFIRMQSHEVRFQTPHRHGQAIWWILLPVTGTPPLRCWVPSLRWDADVRYFGWDRHGMSFFEEILCQFALMIPLISMVPALPE